MAADEARTAGRTVLSGDKAFALHDTYGFPIDLTLEMAAEKGLAVDEDGFRRLMGEQRERAKADARAKKGQHVSSAAYREIADALGRGVKFTGYDEVVTEGAVRGLIDSRGEVIGAAGTGTELELVLDRTPFYAEGGGQLADEGVIELENGARVEVLDVQSPISGLVVHKVRVVDGEVVAGAAAHAVVDVERRRSISRSHTATHMVHKAFREALGETATQAGSENSPGRFRFDFSAAGAVPQSAMADVEARVNDLILADLAVHAELMSQEDAVKSGAMALFGEKYGDTVRVISVGDWARELCGGTHALRSGQLGVVKLLGESSIGSGVRRVEALVGGDAYRFLAREHVLVAQLSEALKVRPEQLPERVDDLLDRLRVAEKRDREGPARAASRRCGRARGERGGGRRGLLGGGQAVEGAGGGDARTLALDVRGTDARRPARRGRDRRRPATGSRRSLLRSTTAGERPVCRRTRWCALPPQVLGGKGGGKDDVAQGGGSDASRALRGARRGAARLGRPLRMLAQQPLGLRLGIDPGDARIGVASCDPQGILATPVETVPRGPGDLDRIAALAEEQEARSSTWGCPGR